MIPLDDRGKDCPGYTRKKSSVSQPVRCSADGKETELEISS
jgi:hypothetical protein